MKLPPMDEAADLFLSILSFSGISVGSASAFPGCYDFLCLYSSVRLQFWLSLGNVMLPYTDYSANMWTVLQKDHPPSAFIQNGDDGTAPPQGTLVCRRVSHVLHTRHSQSRSTDKAAFLENIASYPGMYDIVRCLVSTTINDRKSNRSTA